MKTLAILLLFYFTFLFYGVHSAIITISNNCAYKVWAAVRTLGNGPQLSTTGFELPTKATQSVNVPARFNGRLWGRTGCSTNSTGKFICATGDCGSGQISCHDAGGIILPVTLVEITLAEEGRQGYYDYYDISLVDGFNVPVSISPRGGSGNTCITASCARDVNSDCPNDLAVKGQDGNSVIGCKNACQAFNQPEYCCTESFNTPDTCKKPTNYSMFFKDRCPQAYSYATDYLTSTFSCTSGANYDITFCPDGRIYNRSWANCPTGFLNFSVYNNNLSFLH
ncbi:LOW QUALITY PROTEIN: thaumatin-like protein 1b [Jatropha curcas]|uniref:LOW QUALITY PROTEIN: thaumatin-like protein 1b n=1 Tax=Jatropha curcas TaxID=180498 RepID=UPI001895AF04|nr:LOW QUALITY PROTEIN: thaumatin-like protein 1b [Jatropha curcas]